MKIIHRQDARGKLPLDTATRCIYTYSVREWRHIIDLRYYGTCQNRRKSDVFKEPNGSIHYNGAFTKRATSRYSFATKECSCLKGIRLEDVTEELEDKAYEEIRHN